MPFLNRRTFIMNRILVLGLTLTFCLGLTVSVCAQDTGQKARDLVAALDKNKYKKKEKKGFTVEVYVDVKNEAVLKKNPSEYSGVYTNGEMGSQLTLSVAPGGSVEGSGYDSDDSK